MAFYDIFMAPLEKAVLGTVRKEIISQANGKVLEIGIGSGANTQYYDFAKVSSITGTDIKPFSVLKNARLNNIEYVQCSAESLPFADNSFDTVVTALVLCSVPNAEVALVEIKRVLKPTGTYLFIEHIRPHERLGTTFDALNNLWKLVSHGCQINKKTNILIDNAGFHVISAQEKGTGMLYYGLAKI